MCDFAKNPNDLPDCDRRQNRLCVQCGKRRCDQPEDDICKECWSRADYMSSWSKTDTKTSRQNNAFINRRP